MENKMKSELLTVEDVAGELRVPRSWVYNAAGAGRIPSLKVGRYRRFRRTDLDAFLAGCVDA